MPNSAASKDMTSKIWTNWDTNILLSRKHCGKGRNCSLRAISPFPQCFQKLSAIDVSNEYLWSKGFNSSRSPLYRLPGQNISFLTLYFMCQFWALPIKQQIKLWCQKCGQTRIQLSDWVEKIVGKGEIARYEQFLLFPQCFQKLSVVDVSKWVSME